MKRLDQILFDEYDFDSRTLAKDAILEGRVSINDKIITKPAYKVEEDDIISIASKEYSFASRGGNKLYDALLSFNIDLKDKVVLDIGASTGGFTDVCLQCGASYVYALDSGKEQLIKRLANDKRVKNMEGVNARYLKKDMFERAIDFVCMDVSFISIKLIIDAILSVVDEPFDFVFLIKPQFEVGKDKIGKGGIVKDKKIHIHLLNEMIQYFKNKNLGVENIMKSTTVGRDGNQEYLIHLTNKINQKYFDVDKIVKG